MSKVKILYVEDEPFLGRIVKESLERREFEVYMVADGQAALPAFRKTSPDICVLDVMLPSQDGFSVARDIRLLSPHIPIIFVTAKVQTEDLLKGFDVGGNDYIRKPFSMEELIVRVNNLVRMTRQQKDKPAPAEPADVVGIGRYTFHPSRFELKLDDQIKKLSHRESTLLQMLSENRNATVLRKDILMRLWGDDSFFNSRNLDVYITKLRDYLKEDPRIEIITIKGVGYHFTTG